MTVLADTVVYENNFDNPTSLNSFTQLGDSPASLVDGQLGFIMGEHEYGSVMLNTSGFENYSPLLKNNDGIISWAFNVSNKDGVWNNVFSMVLASSQSNPFDINAKGYVLTGGGLCGSEIMFQRFDYGVWGGAAVLLSIDYGIDVLPEKGSVKVTYNPENDEWNLFVANGEEYQNPQSLTESLDVDVDGR
jgi:hypothetical protein